MLLAVLNKINITCFQAIYHNHFFNQFRLYIIGCKNCAIAVSFNLNLIYSTGPTIVDNFKVIILVLITP